MLKNMIKVLLSNFGVIIVGICSSFILPKLLSISDYASYQTFILFMSYSAALHLGFPSGMFIKYGGHRFSEIDKRDFKTEFIIIIMLLSFFTVLAFGLSFIFKSTMLTAVALTILPYCLVSSFMSLYQAWGEFQKYSIINFFIPAGTILLYFLVFLGTQRLNSLVCMVSYITVYYIVAIFVILNIRKSIQGIKPRRIFSRGNGLILKNGFLLMIGNYINTLFLSVDKQYIRLFYTDKAFAIYSFAMSMQTIMVVFVTSIAQPLFPKMARKDMPEKNYMALKELLFIFGSFSGCVYFACVFFVQHFIPKYMDSITIIGYYFTVFPAMAVINCLLINLYKAQGIITRYMQSLVIVLIIAIALAGCVVMSGVGYQFIAVTTVITYYIWLLIGIRDFKFLRFTLHDFIFISVFIALLLTTTHIVHNAILGCLLNFFLSAVNVLIIYHKHLPTYLRLIGVKLNGAHKTGNV